VASLMTVNVDKLNLLPAAGSISIQVLL